MDIEEIKKVINGKFDKIESKINNLDNILSEKIADDNKIDEEVISYIAGFFDGEGMIEISKELRLLTQTGNTNLDILKRIKSVFSGEIYPREARKEGHKKQWSWQITDRDKLKFFLETILPYSTVKKSQILDALEFLENTTNSMGKRLSSEERKYRESMHLKNQELKCRIYTDDEIKQFTYQIDNTTQSQKMFDKSVYSYISGFFDAEGTVGVYGNINESLYLTSRIKNTYPNILIGMKQVFGGNVTKLVKSKNPNHRQQWIWGTGDKDDIKFFLTKILPYSIIKTSQIKLGLKFLETYNYNAQQIIANKLKEMKDVEHTDDEIKELNKQINDMNIDKHQKTMMDF